MDHFFGAGQLRVHVGVDDGFLVVVPSAIFGLGRLLGHECMSVNAIVANRVVQQFSADSNATVEKLITQALEVLAR